MEDVMRNSS